MEEIIKRLKEITSYYSFGRILGYIAFKETIGIEKQFAKEQAPNKERLISNEIDFLAGMWLSNVVLDKNWTIDKDDMVMSEVYLLMDKLHNEYTNVTDLSSQFIETFFYEGDLGYDWQFVNFAQKKYDNPDVRRILLDEHNIDISALSSTLRKIRTTIENQLRRRIEEKRKKNQYISPINAFSIKPNIIRKNFSKDEQNVIRALSIKLGNPTDNIVTYITDANPFRITPIIELPNNRGIFIIDENAVAIAMNESPYLRLVKDKNLGKRLGTIRGKTAENIVSTILERRFPKASLKHIDIRRTKSSNQITDIDALFTHQDIGTVFQVKSKMLTHLSHQGDLKSIEEDCKKAIIDAYEQGKICISCLKEASNYYTLKKYFNATESLTWYNVCITLDAFPGISSLCYINQTDTSEVPLVAMSVYDLDIIFYLFQSDTIVEYMKFRILCAKNRIYGISEIYYIGAFMAKSLEGHLKMHGNKIPREYAVYADYIIKKAKDKLYRNIDVQCSLVELLKKFPVKEYITCL